MISKKNSAQKQAVIPKISIAMGTFNGSKYILDQLKSLAEQHHLPYELVVCDDCSTDNTFQILENFRGSAPFEVRLYRNDRNLGFADNFLKAASLCRGEWISFCDQDDFWLPEKLLNCATAIQNNEKALLVLQNAYISDVELKDRTRIFPNSIKPRHYGPLAQYGFWVWPGFLQTFRSNLVRGIPQIERPISYYPGHKIQPHDKWTCMIANSLGGIVVLSEPVALYRRHSETVTGDYCEQKARDRVNKSALVSAAHYRFLSAAAQSSANHLRSLVEYYSDPDLRKNMSASAEAFDKIRDLQNLRALIYDEKSPFVRLFLILRIFSCGGYIGPSISAMGVMSAFKDLAYSLGALRHLRTGSRL